MSKILFDKKRKKRIIHIAGHGKRQRLRKNTLFLKCLHLNCDSQLYILSHPSIHKNPLPGGFLCLLGIFYLFETIGRRGVSQSKCPEGGTRLPSGSWAGDGMPCNGNDRRQWRIQGVAVGAAASKTQATRSGCWEPQPEFASGEQMLKLNILQNSAGPRF